VRDTFVATLTELAAADPQILLMTGDLGFGVLDKFAARFPQQYLNVGVAEQNLTGLATGIALEGRIVFTYSIANFPTLRCLEQIRNDVCYHDANVKIVSIGAGFSYGALGISHHATEDISIMRALPGMTVISPCDKWEVSEAVRALVNTPGPALLRLDKSAASTEGRPGERFLLGKARMLQDGRSVTLVAVGGIMGEVLQAATVLNAEGISCRILSMHTVKPLDTESLEKAAIETGGIITVEEHTVEGGLGGAVAECLLESGGYPKCFLRIGLKSEFSWHVGSQNYLRKLYGLDANSIALAVKSKLGISVDTPKSIRVLHGK
jgi:transketolase